MAEEAVRPDDRMAQVRATMQAPQQDGRVGTAGDDMLHVRSEVERVDASSVTAIAGENDRVLVAHGCSV